MEREDYKFLENRDLVDIKHIRLGGKALIKNSISSYENGSVDFNARCYNGQPKKLVMQLVKGNNLIHYFIQ